VRRPSGRYLLRNQILQKHGWLVVSLPYFEWNSRPSLPNKLGYLKALLARAEREAQGEGKGEGKAEGKAAAPVRLSSQFAGHRSGGS
jgi:hypothetical protein